MERQRTEKGVSMVEKLRQGVLKKGSGGVGASCTTPPPSWRLELPSSPSSPPSSYGCDNNNNKKNKDTVQVQEFLNILPTPTTISARKLCANLWEIHQYQQHTPLARMNNPATRLCRRRRHRLHHRRDNVLEVHKRLAYQPPDTSSDKAASASSFRRHVAASLVRHHRSAERKGCNSQPVSPASYSSSVKVAPYNPSAAPTNSTDFKGMIGESSYNLTTSKELLKVLSRIWSLEEQHESNISAVKALKMELYHSQAQMKELLQEKQTNRHEMENLMKRMTVEKLVRKNNENDRIKAAVQSIKEELEDERRLRKRSESLHRKFARELPEVKSSFSGCLRNLERERKARILLENLCDEFAKGIRDYEQEVHSLRWNSEKGHVKENNSLDRLILHISEAWLDERMQMKLSQSGNDLMERSSIVDKLGFDIETFLHTKRSVDLKKYGYSSPKELKEIYPCRQSMDSFPLKEVASAPQNMAQEDSIDADSHEPKSFCQSNKTTEVHQEKKAIQNSMMKQVLQSKEVFEACEFQPIVCRNMSCDDNESCFVERKSSEMGEDNNTTLLMNEEAIKVQQKGDNRPSWTLKMNSSHKSNNPVGNSSLSSEGGDKVYPECVCRGEDSSSWVQPALTADGSLVKLWKSMLTVPDFDKAACVYPSQTSPGWSIVHCANLESSTKLPEGVKENTLMAKLLEARLEGKKSHSRSSKSTPSSNREVSDEKKVGM